MGAATVSCIAAEDIDPVSQCSDHVLQALPHCLGTAWKVYDQGSVPDTRGLTA